MGLTGGSIRGAITTKARITQPNWNISTHQTTHGLGGTEGCGAKQDKVCFIKRCGWMDGWMMF